MFDLHIYRYWDMMDPDSLALTHMLVEDQMELQKMEEERKLMLPSVQVYSLFQTQHNTSLSHRMPLR